MKSMAGKAWLGLLALAAPLASETVVTLKSHSDAIQMMGQNLPAKDEIHTYWFGEKGVRMDQGETSMILDFAGKKMYVVQHVDKTFTPIDLPIDMNKLMPPEMAAVMQQMMQMMGGSTKVTPLDRSGSYAGFACKFYRIDISMPMMTTSMENCMSEALPIDYSRYSELIDIQGQMFPNAKWLRDLAKVKGFPVRSDSTVSAMGSSFKSWQELASVDEKPAPAGLYNPPPGYREVKFDPLRQQQGQRRNK